MRTIKFLYWLLLASFVIELTFNYSISVIPGFSLKNITTYSMLLALLFINPALNKPFIEKNRVNIPIILFIGFCFLSLIITDATNVVPNYSATTEFIFLKGYMDPYVLFIVVYSAVHDERSIINMLLGLVVIFCVFVGITLLSYDGTINVERIVVNERYGRTKGAFSEPNQFAAYLVMFMPLLGAFYLNTKSKFWKVCIAFVALASFYVLLLAGSRGGLVALAVGVGVYYLLLSRHSTGKSIIYLFGVYASLLMILGIVAYLIPPEAYSGLMSKITGEFTENSSSDYSAGRLDVWLVSLKEFLTSPLIGLGWRTYIFYFGYNSHNDYVLFLVTTGIIGFSLFVMIYYRLLTSVLDIRKKEGRYKHFYDAYIAGLVSILVAIFFVNLYSPTYFVMLFSALTLKLGVVALSNKPVPAGEDSSKDDELLPDKVIRRKRQPMLSSSK